MKASEMAEYKELNQRLKGIVLALISIDTNPIKNLVTTLDDIEKAMEKLINEVDDLGMYENERG